MNRLGIIDWGIGGVSIYKLIKQRIGDVGVTYFSDTGVTPYGKMERDELTARLNDVIAFLRSRGVTHVVIGCNAASTAIGRLADHGIPVEGVIEPAVAMTARLAPNRLGLIGGRRTVVSGVYRKAFAKHGIAVNQRIAQPLSGMIESGDIASDELQDASREILAPLRNCSHILLACTHYPAILPVLRKMVSPETRFIDPASELVSRVRSFRLKGSGSNLFLTTGDADAMRSAALSAFGVKLERISTIRVDPR